MRRDRPPAPASASLVFLGRGVRDFQIALQGIAAGAVAHHEGVDDVGVFQGGDGQFAHLGQGFGERCRVTSTALAPRT